MEMKPVAGVDRSSLLRDLNNEGIEITWESYSSPVIPRWAMKPDASVTGGFEIVSKPLEGMQEIEHEITRMTNALKRKVYVDRECGHHVHIALLEKYWARRRVDVSTRQGRRKAIRSKQVKIFCGKLLKNYGHFQKVIDAIVAPSRRVLSGGYTYNDAIPSHYANMTNEEIESLNYVNINRASVINYDSLVQYGTVEFRQFQGTTNKTKIMNWMRLVERFCARTSDRKYKNVDARNFPQTIDGMCDFLGFGKYGVRRWARNRAISNGFGGLATESVPEVINSISEPRNPTVGQLCNHDNCNNPVTDEDRRTQHAQYGTRAPVICASCEEAHQVNIAEEDNTMNAYDMHQERVNPTPPEEADNCELTESLLVLENNYNSYHRLFFQFYIHHRYYNNMVYVFHNHHQPNT